MTGFHHDELADVNLITDNLRDRYKDHFSILKELVQNADDAGARKMTMALFPGEAKSEHPLLHGPGLVIVNDGPFTEKDSRAIRSFGINSKAADAATIGKFGLGMKSVFHLAEALVFMAECEGRVFIELLTPWGNIRSDWDVASEARQLEFSRLRGQWLNATKWKGESVPFVLYLPLRRRSHLQLSDGRVTGAIIENYPGDDGQVLALLRDEALGGRLASLLPLLRDLTSIHVYLDGTAEDTEPAHSCEIIGNSTRPLRAHIDGQSELKASLILGQRRVRSIGWQRHMLTERLELLRHSSAWPASWIRNGEYREERVPDKAQPHAAATFAQSLRPGILLVRWAVFLPVDEHEEWISIDPRMGGYELTLHGQFFVDAGRNGLYGLDQPVDETTLPNEEARVRRDWNRALAEESTLDLVLPALNSFCQELRIPEDRVAAITGAVKQSLFWTRWRKHIAGNHTWLRSVDREGTRWTLVNEERTLPLPSVTREDPERPWRVFPALAQFAGRAVFYDPDAQNLVARENDFGYWDDAEVQMLIQSIDLDRTFTTITGLEYLIRFLNQVRPINSDIVQEELCSLLRRAVKMVGLERLRRSRERISTLAAFIAPTRKLRISLRDSGIVEYLIEQPTKTLLWPSELDSGTATSNTDPEDIELLLVRLAERGEGAESYRLYAEELLSLLSREERRSLLDRVDHLAILSAFDWQSNQRTAVSAARLKQVLGRNTLYRAGQGIADNHRAPLGQVLQRVIPDESVLVITKEVASIVFGEAAAEAMLACDAGGVLESLGSHAYSLANISSRIELLRGLQLPDHSPSKVRGMRYLLHGSGEHHGDNSVLWLDLGNEPSAWRKVWAHALGDAGSWKVIHPQIAAEITPAEHEALGMRHIVPEQVVNFVAQHGLSEDLRLSDAESTTVLSNQQWGERKWKELPLHLTTSGARVRATDGAFLEIQDFQLPPALLNQATVLCLSNDPRIADLQRRWLPKLDCSAAIDLALRDEEPTKWGKHILDWLTDCEAPLSSELVRSTPWLKMTSDASLSPQNLIILPEIESDIAEIAYGVHGFGTVSLLDPQLRHHPALAKLCNRAQSVETLCRLIERIGNLSIGEVTLEIAHLEVIADAMASCPEPVAKGWRLLNCLCKAFGELETQHILRRLTKPISQIEIKRILKWLASQTHSNRAFDLYLGALVQSGPTTEILEGLDLRTKSGAWKKASELCFEVPGVDHDYSLCSEHGQILQDVIHCGWARHAESAPRTTSKEPVESLREFFTPWLQRGDRIRVQVGVILTLLAGGTELNKDASNYLAPHSREWLLSQFPLTSAQTGQSWDPLTPDLAIGRRVIRFEALSVNRASCLSLLGRTIAVPLEARVKNLINGIHLIEVKGGLLESYYVRFRMVTVSTFSDDELSSMLRATAESIMAYIFHSRLSLDILWAKLEHTEQLHVKTAEKLLFEYLPFYLSQIRPTGSGVLLHLLQSIEEKRRLKVEHEGRAEYEQISHDYENLRSQLKSKLQEDPNVQRAVITGIRNRLRDWEYQSTSIPFELFQNADDAYVQIHEIRSIAGLPRPAANDRFVVSERATSLSFAHWGRPVNFIGGHQFDGRQRNYHRDLEKMLVLNSSEKQLNSDETESRVTGKFGLGFKSVLLVCDRPQIASGGIQCEIVGGVLPKVLSGSVAGKLREKLDHLSGNEAVPGTIITLQDIAPAIQGQLTLGFRKHAGFLCAFGLSIREIQFDDEAGIQIVNWSGAPVSEVEAISIGRLHCGTEGVMALRIQTKNGVVLFGLGSHGFVDLPRGTPAVWAICPTQEHQQFGFAVCANFDVDPGRARLSADEESNIALAEKIGAQLGLSLRALQNVPWDRARKDLKITPTATEYEFWNSLWSLFQRTLKESANSVGKIMATVLVKAFESLARDLSVIPNGLGTPKQLLTSGSKIKVKLSGAFNLEDLATHLFMWSQWEKRGFTPETTISSSKAFGLTKIGFDEFPSLGFITVASWLSGQTITEADATVLGTSLQCLPKEDDRSDDVANDLRQARIALESVQFRSEGNTFERPRDMVAVTANDDETRRALFAPDTHRLSKTYDAAGIAFFRFCRGPMAIGSLEIAQWIIGAPEGTCRQAALRYLNDGELAVGVRKHLQERSVAGSWLSDPLALAQFPTELLEPLYQPVLVRPTSLIPQGAARDPRAFLENVSRWWDSNHVEELMAYDQRLYPKGKSPVLKSLFESTSDRSEWLVVLTRAAFYRMGRTGDHQHRAYIEYVQRRGWWKVFSTSNPRDRAHEWMRVLDEFHDDQSDVERWEHWMRCFPAIYKLACRLEDYVEIFLDLGRECSSFDLMSRINSRIDAGRSGGGIDAPPPSLGIGACFVVRELLRMEHIQCEYAHEHAFVPTGAIRGLFGRIGLPVDDYSDVLVSKQLFQHISERLGKERATFHRAFDIPFQIIASNPNLEAILLQKAAKLGEVP